MEISKIMKLEEIYNKSKDSERDFEHKSILFIGSESYDAPTITVLQGLDQLGFNIYTIKKPNINSWFCNQIVKDIDDLKFDFVLSNLHWGTRWSYYKKYNHELESYMKILIDGDDNINLGSWRNKYDYYTRNYTYNPPESIKDLNLMPYRWVEPLYDYKPDLVFTSQKQFNDNDSVYLPFGLHEQYRTFFKAKKTFDREIDFAHIPGPGIKRENMARLIGKLSRFNILPGEIHNSYVRGEKIVPESIKHNVLNDDNIHSYHRWIMNKSYFEVLNNSKVLIYPGIDKWPFWDSKRPWEGYASGCLVLMSKPCIDVSEYPLTEICDYAVYNSYFDFIKKWQYLYKNPSFLDELRVKAFKNAIKYFSPKPIANYYLMRIKDHNEA